MRACCIAADSSRLNVVVLSRLDTKGLSGLLDADLVSQ